MTITADWHKLAAEIKDVDDRESITVKEFSELINKSHPTAYRRLREMVKAGTATETTKYVKNRYAVAFSLVKK